MLRYIVKKNSLVLQLKMFNFTYIMQGFSVEEATGIVVGGDVDVDFVTVTSLPQDDIWKALPKPDKEVEIFVGIMSNSDNFAERMAIRKTWFQSKSIQLLQVVPRFFVALVLVVELFLIKCSIIYQFSSIKSSQHTIYNIYSIYDLQRYALELQ
jgi:hypothetical protein